MAEVVALLLGITGLGTVAHQIVKRWINRIIAEIQTNHNTTLGATIIKLEENQCTMTETLNKVVIMSESNKDAVIRQTDLMREYGVQLRETRDQVMRQAGSLDR